MSEPTVKPEPDDQPAVLVLELRIPAGASYGDSPLPAAVEALNRAIEESDIEPAAIVRMWAGIRETADAVAAIHWDQGEPPAAPAAVERADGDDATS